MFVVATSFYSIPFRQSIHKIKKKESFQSDGLIGMRNISGLCI